MLFRIFLLFFVVKSLLFAETRLFECNKIFEERKNELILELERLNDKEASLQALTEETNKLLKMKKAKLDKQEAEINQKLDMISEKENRIEEMLNENKKLLSEIEKLKMTKVSETYSKMKPKAAAAILENLEPKEAVKILLNIKAKILSKIFSKMDPVKASRLTKVLTDIQDLKKKDMNERKK